MTDEKTEKRLPKEETPEVPERTDVVVRGGASRCPHCHDNVNSEEDAWAACRGCLARHHVSCWGEGGACSACGEKRFVSSVPARQPARAQSNRLAFVLVGIAMVIVLGTLGWSVSIRNRAQALEGEVNRLAALERERDAELNVLRLARVSQTPGPETGFTRNVFSTREKRELVYTPLGAAGPTHTNFENTTDVFAVEVARHVVAGDQLENKPLALTVLATVRTVMKDDPSRKDDMALIDRALAILRGR